MAQLLLKNDYHVKEGSTATAVETFSAWRDSAAAKGSQERYHSLLPATPPDSGQQYAFEVDLDTCSGCKACVTACHSLNGLEPNETWRKVGQLASIETRLPIIQHITTACHHCVDPGCLSGCPVNAYVKEPLSGIVRHLDDQCIGCKYCTMMCPYEVPQYSQALGIVRKCDMCSQRMSAGEAPACVQACPNSAIRITLVDQDRIVQQAKADGAVLVPTAPLSSITYPTTQFIGRIQAASSCLRSSLATELHPEHSHWPLVLMLVFTQASVGLWTIACYRSSMSALGAMTHSGSLQVAMLLALIGVHVALLHLGRPWLAFRGFLGWRSSWLSREVIAFAVYMAVAGIAVVIDAMDKMGAGLASAPSAMVSCVARWSACGCGWLALGCSGMVYIATRRALWSWPRIGLEFTATAVSLGAALSATVETHSVCMTTWLLAISWSAATFALMPKWFDWRLSQNALPSSNSFVATSSLSGRLLTEHFGPSWRIAWLLVIALVTGLIVWGQWWPTNADLVPITGKKRWLAGAFSLILLAILIQVRRLSFATVVFPRMPGAVV